MDETRYGLGVDVPVAYEAAVEQVTAALEGAGPAG